MRLRRVGGIWEKCTVPKKMRQCLKVSLSEYIIVCVTSLNKLNHFKSWKFSKIISLQNANHLLELGCERKLWVYDKNCTKFLKYLIHFLPLNANVLKTKERGGGARCPSQTFFFLQYYALHYLNSLKCVSRNSLVLF